MSKKDVPSLLKEMANREPFVRMLNIKVLEIKAGYARVQATIGPEMLNIHGITHGGALFALVDEGPLSRPQTPMEPWPWRLT